MDNLINSDQHLPADISLRAIYRWKEYNQVTLDSQWGYTKVILRRNMDQGQIHTDLKQAKVYIYEETNLLPLNEDDN